jgi:Putative transposase
VEALSQVFRGKFTEGLRDLYKRGKLRFHGSLMKIAGVAAFNRFIQVLRNKDWVVYAKPPFGGPEQVLKYLARYTHRVAISNSRLVDFRDGNVSFLWRDYAHGGKQKVMTISAHEFLRRFLLHVLPGGLVRIRHFGLFANRRRGSTLARCRSLLHVPPADPLPTPPMRCPSCSSIMVIVERLSCAQLYFRAPVQPVPTSRFSANTG